eukprot:363026-Chlamydomonas_euryale.AAC.4
MRPTPLLRGALPASFPSPLRPALELGTTTPLSLPKYFPPSALELSGLRASFLAPIGNFCLYGCMESDHSLWKATANSIKASGGAYYGKWADFHRGIP